MTRVSVRITKGKRGTDVRMIRRAMRSAVMVEANKGVASEIGPAIMDAIARDMATFARQIGDAFTSSSDSPVGVDDLRVPFVPLSRATIARKEGDATFYRDTGALRQALDAYLPAVMAQMFAPEVVKRGQDKLFIQVFRGNTPTTELQHAIVTGQWTDAGRPEASAPTDIWAKLNDNPRSWIGPSLAYWALVRFPRVAAAAIRSVTR